MKTKTVNYQARNGKLRTCRLSASNLLVGETLQDRGVSRVGAYLLPKLKKIIIEWHSVWDKGNGEIQGTYYLEADSDEFRAIAIEADQPELIADIDS